MTTIKAFTDLEQSRKLAKILPLESADMWWVALNWQETEYYVEVKQDGINQPKKAIPCWSLAALISVLPHIQEFYPIIGKINDKYVCRYASSGIWTNGANPVDACVAMIERLHELKML